MNILWTFNEKLREFQYFICSFRMHEYVLNSKRKPHNVNVWAILETNIGNISVILDLPPTEMPLTKIWKMDVEFAFNKPKYWKVSNVSFMRGFRYNESIILFLEKWIINLSYLYLQQTKSIFDIYWQCFKPFVSICSSQKRFAGSADKMCS